MTKQEILEFINNNPVLFLATIDHGQPRVRGMLLYKADEKGIVFHTGIMKDVYQQVIKNPQVEMCFNDFQKGIQVRVQGELELIDDNNLKDEISNHPSRQFLTPWKESISQEEFYNAFAVFRLKKGKANVWTMEMNLVYPRTEIEL